MANVSRRVKVKLMQIILIVIGFKKYVFNLNLELIDSPSQNETQDRPTHIEDGMYIRAI